MKTSKKTLKEKSPEHDRNGVEQGNVHNYEEVKLLSASSFALRNAWLWLLRALDLLYLNPILPASMWTSSCTLKQGVIVTNSS